MHPAQLTRYVLRHWLLPCLPSIMPAAQGDAAVGLEPAAACACDCRPAMPGRHHACCSLTLQCYPYCTVAYSSLSSTDHYWPGLPLRRRRSVTRARCRVARTTWRRRRGWPGSSTSTRGLTRLDEAVKAGRHRGCMTALGRQADQAGPGHLAVKLNDLRTTVRQLDSGQAG